MNEVKDYRSIPKASIILPELIPLIIPEFVNHSVGAIPNVLSFKSISTEDWFDEFVGIVVSKIGKEYYPVMRMSDGEFIFLLGKIYPYPNGHTFLHFLKKIINTSKERLIRKDRFQAATLPGVSSGDYSQSEIRLQKSKIEEQIKLIATHGILAVHLSYGVKPFQEHFHRKFAKWLKEKNIPFSKNNYFPFYFVYALLRGPLREKVLKNKTVLIFHSATGAKKERIVQSLIDEGVKSVIWHEISPSRSMFEEINLNQEYFTADIAFIGAGVGKFNILAQLSNLKIPCVDVGFVFEVWADEENKWKRPMMVSDFEWNRNKIEFI